MAVTLARCGLVRFRAARIRRVVSAGVFAAAMAFTASPLGQPAVARADYSETEFEACMNRCCEHAGGVMRSGACIDPATLRQQGPGQTSPTRHPLPTVAPPPTNRRLAP
jgi:hypothetical protein